MAPIFFTDFGITILVACDPFRAFALISFTDDGIVSFFILFGTSTNVFPDLVVNIPFFTANVLFAFGQLNVFTWLLFTNAVLSISFIFFENVTLDNALHFAKVYAGTLAVCSGITTLFSFFIPLNVAISNWFTVPGIATVWMVCLFLSSFDRSP